MGVSAGVRSCTTGSQWASRVLRPTQYIYITSFRRWIFPGNCYHWYWQLKTNITKYTKNTQKN